MGLLQRLPTRRPNVRGSIVNPTLAVSDSLKPKFVPSGTCLDRRAAAPPLSTENISGGSGADTLTGDGAGNVLNGNAGPDALSGVEGNDTLGGGAGDDRFDEGASANGADSLSGDAGEDTADYSPRTEAITLTIGAGSDDGESGEGDTVLASTENALGGSAADSLTGDGGSNVLGGNGGDDALSGQAGDDTLNGGLGDETFSEGGSPNGADQLNGDGGTDAVDYSSRSQAVNVTIGAGADDGEAGEGDNVSATTENVSGGAGADMLGGDGAGNVLSGNGGLDVLTGGSGDDTLNGGAGDETFAEGGSPNGADTLNGDGGTDTVDYSGRGQAVTVTIGSGPDDGEAGEGDTVSGTIENAEGGSGADTLTGEAGVNVLGGNGGPDTLVGSAGNDTLNGGDGADSLSGGDGDDTENGGSGDEIFNEGSSSSGSDQLNGDGGNDTADYSARGQAVMVTLAGGSDDGEAGEGDNVSPTVENAEGGSGSDALTGDGAANALGGNGGSDALLGAGGDDTLNGGDGQDTLEGEAGNDSENGGAGDDELDEGNVANGADTLVGGAGSDTVDYSGRSVAVLADIDGTPDDGEAGESDAVGADVEALIGGQGPDRLAGSPESNTLSGNGGDDVIDSRDLAADIVACGSGTDSVSADASDDLAPDCESGRSPGGDPPTGDPAPGGQPAPPVPPADDRADLSPSRLILSGLAMTRTRFRIGSRWPLRRPHPRPPGMRILRGTVFSFRLSRAATVVVQVRPAGAGAARVCQTRDGRRTCYRETSRGTLRWRASQGSSRVRWNGFFGNEPLRPGKYVATVRAVTAGTRSRARLVSFQVLSSRKAEKR